ncbi:MAG TPA: GNAT family N-acetyltransferase [Povalibacter sp.]
MRADLTIRELRAGDRSRWDELWAGYLQFYKEDLPPAITDATWHRLIDPSQQLHGLAALDASGRVVGIVHYLFHPSTWALGNYCYLEDLFVDPAARGAGAGRALIEAVYQAADEKGATRVYWSTEKDNARAQALYNQIATLTPFVQYRR